jgi:hypothetical protein
MTQFNSSGLAPFNEINVFWRSDGEFSPSRISELSRKGAFIQTPDPAPVGTSLDVRVDAPGREICAQAVVRRVASGQGMAVEFELITEDDRDRLHALVREIEVANVLQVARSASPPPGIPLGHRSAQTPTRAEAAQHPRNRPIDRRSRFRHKSAATVELTEFGSTERVRGLLADLGRGGCYVKLEAPLAVGTDLELSITENGQSFQALASVVSADPGKGMGLMFAAIEPEQLAILDGWLAISMERRWLSSNRRRSQRVMVNIPVHVAAKNHKGLDVVEETKTVSVSAHGALLRLEMTVTKGQTIVLRNPSTNDALECSVDYLGNTQDGRREVGVSFVQPNRTLWQIAFPPADWSPQHPHAKG